ncbi:hypothetical protein JOC54_003102 [Alkalihalobacillus xiaoxiensis]|uniref:Uncharacterized protein n=1 Tax=Shouchella xiaoxiensis TaxID=766895 RepID=A0ABS2SWA5_9BACI|nr:hypothetical protein [Shouchella xiaoxiensis]MBM7839822.1 hypothetical protein [Shouchella xiaoxiensis]
MIDHLERELFRRELQFLLHLKEKVTEKESRFTKMLDDQISHLETILEETKMPNQ